MFTEEEKIWIVMNFEKHGHAMAVRRAFMGHFKVSRQRGKKLHRDSFVKIINHFKQTGSIERKKRSAKIPNDERKNVVKNFFVTDPTSSTRKASKALGFSQTTVMRVLRNELQFKPYHYHIVQRLKEEHKMQRLNWARWMLTQSEDFPLQVLWSDEKYFILHPHPNRRNDHYWSFSNPHLVKEVKEQGVEKVLVWAGLLNGRVFMLHWFHENGKNVCVNKDNYLSMLKEKVWPKLEQANYDFQVFFMQDGASAHTAKVVRTWLADKFGDNVISRLTTHPWPAKSPDCNPLDFFLWGAIEAQVFKRSPKSIEELKRVVEDIAFSLDANMIQRACKNVFKRAQLIIDVKGGHFEHLLKTKREST